MNSRYTNRNAVHIDGSLLDALVAKHPDASLVDQVFKLIADLVQGTEIGPGTRLPSVRNLAAECSISSDTVARAYERLVAHGLVEARRGSGYFVRQQPGVRSRGGALQGPMSGPMAAGVSRWRTNLVKSGQSLLSKTGAGHFPASWYDEGLIGTALRAVARQGSRAFSQYADLLGYLPLRQHIQGMLNEQGIFCQPDDILITHGSMEGIHLICQSLLLAHGSSVALERPCQPLLADRLLSTGAEIRAVDRHHDGPSIEQLRTICEKFRPKAFFCQSILHNPTGGSITPQKAYQILRLAEEFNFYIVEDDTYADLSLRTTGRQHSRMASLDQFTRVIYLGGFSKTLGPGIRLGFIAAQSQMIDLFAGHRIVQCISGSPINERLLYQILAGGGYRRHCEQLKNRLAEIRPAVVADIQSWGFGTEAEFSSSPYLWVDLGKDVNSLDVAERMLEIGHLIAPGSAFMPFMEQSCHIRVNIAEAFGSPAIAALGKMLGKRRRAP